RLSPHRIRSRIVETRWSEIEGRARSAKTKCSRIHTALRIQQTLELAQKLPRRRSFQRLAERIEFADLVMRGAQLAEEEHHSSAQIRRGRGGPFVGADRARPMSPLRWVESPPERPRARETRSLVAKRSANPSNRGP